MKQFAMLLMSLLALQSMAQHGKYYLDKADLLAHGNLYYEAVPVYKKAYTKAKPEQKAKILYKIGECYRHQWKAAPAAEWYKKSIKAGYNDPMVWFRLGETHKQKGNYQKAKEAFEQFLELKPNDATGLQAVESCTQSLAWLAEESRVGVEAFHPANSSANDFRPFFVDQEHRLMYFTSDREAATGQRIHGWTGEDWPDVFAIKQSRNGSWSSPVPISGGVNTDVGEGSVCIDATGKRMFFTRCNFKPHGIAGCEIYTSKRQGNSWSQAELIPIDLDTFNVGHPCLMPAIDGSKAQTLVFSANIDGGFGGRDLWYITETDEGWSEPTNLGPEINTAGNEIYPYVWENGELYFASDGWPGMGGMDLFVASNVGPMQWTKPQNMKPPFNSPRDDFGLLFDSNTETGYFSSNRKDGNGDDDIYRFYTHPLVVDIVPRVYDVDTQEPIAGVEVAVADKNGVQFVGTTDETGTAHFEVAFELENAYLFEYRHETFLTERSAESTVGLTESTTFEHRLFMKRVVVGEDTGYEMPQVLYALADWRLLPEATDSLAYILQLMNDHPTFVIQIESHTDIRGSAKYNQKLSEKRAQSVVTYLVEKGINPQRLKWRGYGEEHPLFNEEFINGLATEEEREAAHQRNRRTEFSILRTDFEPAPK